ncbi:MAG TPA: undecaprenyl-diphosphate phosphatase [Telmatospirillum sp.]|nr:undecaprenyl-diphosphate phosphatase [Telmatospirillum sp.]
MQLPDIVIFALAEGVADILPVDATAHSLVVAKLLGWRAGTIGAAIHLGAAFALLLYLWRDVLLIGQGLWKLRRARIEPGTSLLAKALLAAFPWLAATTLLGAAPVPGLADLVLVGAVTIFCALLMGVVDKLCMTVKRTEHLSGLTALIVGVAQLFALVPGVGRVAAALTAVRMLGLERPDAYRFVLLVNIPILLADGIAHAVHYSLDGLQPSDSDFVMFGVTCGLVLLALSISMAWIRRAGLLPFALYRLLLGVGLICLGVL